MIMLYKTVPEVEINWIWKVFLQVPGCLCFIKYNALLPSERMVELKKYKNKKMYQRNNRPVII